MMRDQITDIYAKWLCHPAGEMADRSPGVAEPTEATMQQWWASLPQGTRFETVEGHRIEVIHPGIQNRGAGPDFIHAHLAFNGELARGSVEIHRAPAAWKDHGHHTDPRYDGVILHVTTEPVSSTGVAARTNAGRFVATLVISSDTPGAAAFAPLEPAPLPARCRASRSPGAKDMEGLLWLAASWRLLRKSRDIAERAAHLGMEQALYERIMTACGWGGNESLMEALARAIPCERLRQMARQHEYLPEAALLHMAGFLPMDPPETMDPAALVHWARLHALREQFLPGLKRLNGAPYPARGRPLNRPERRLAAAARVIARTALHGVGETLLKPWYELDATAPARVIARLIALFEVRHGFWEFRCGWTASQLARPVALIGRDRALAMAGNIALPLALVHARERGSITLEQRICACLRAFPAEPDSAPLKWMRQRLFGGRYPFRAGFALQQGLLQLHRDWCGHNLTCENCPVPDALDNVPTEQPGNVQSR